MNIIGTAASTVTTLKDMARNYYVKRRLRRTFRSRVLELVPPGTSPRQMFGGTDDDDWLWLNTEGRRRSPALQEIIPSLPDEEIQANFTGAVGDKTLRQGFTHYQLFRQIVAAQGGDLRRYDAILDFGCGWGRIIRYFLRDVEPSVLWGADVDTGMIDFCKQSNKWCKFVQISFSPPTQLPSDTFDLIYCFSVFSHLSEDVHKNWLAEIRRILKSGGLFIATTRSRDFFRRCAWLRWRPDFDSLPAGIRSSAKVFHDVEQCLRDYDSGKYCFGSHGNAGDWSSWGDTAIPKGYVVNHWTQHFALLDYIDDPWLCPQNVIVVCK